MKPDAVQLLSGVEAFLADIADRVPAGMRSDVRAAAKSLANARQELDQLFPLLILECEELREACACARKALGEAQSDMPGTGPFNRLSELSEQHAGLLDLVGDYVLALQERDSPEARSASILIYKMLRQQGGRRLGWQSVFPSDRLVSDVLKSSWQEKMT